MKRSIVFFIFVLFFALLSTLMLVFFADNTSEQPTNKKYYVVSQQKNNVLLSIAFYILRPIIENYIDSRLEKGGIIKYIEKQNFMNKAIKIVDMKTGTGRGVFCGQTVNISFFDKNKMKKLQTIKIGTDERSILNVGLIGMKKGGIRVLCLHEEITVSMIDVLDDYPYNLEEMQVFSNKNLDKKAHMCGENVKVHYQVKDFKNNTVIEGDVAFKIGSREVPVAIEQGSIEIQENSEKVVLAPKNLLQQTDSMKKEIVDAFKGTNLREDMYLVKITLLQEQI